METEAFQSFVLPRARGFYRQHESILESRSADTGLESDIQFHSTVVDIYTWSIDLQFGNNFNLLAFREYY